MRFTGWWIAWRYLRSKKSHGAVSAIAAVSVAGVAVATAAVVCILSVFNGFKEVLSDRYDVMAPDITVNVMEGKAFSGSDSIVNAVGALPGVEIVMPVVSDKALAVFNGKELPITIKGVESDKYEKITDIKDIIFKGGRMPSDYYEELPEFQYIEDYEEYMANARMPEVLASIGAAVRLGNIAPGETFTIFAPRREGQYNPANPMASFVADSVAVSGVYQARQKDYDEDLVVVPIGLARHLFEYDDQSTALEIKLAPGANPDQVKSEIASMLGPGYSVKDRMEIEEVNFRMINIEKWVTFLLLFFILVIATFNIVSTMTMLVLEKKRQLSIMNSLGMSLGGVSRIFRHESMLVSLTGGVIGIVIGVVLCLLQQHYGLIRLAGNPETLLMQVYPVKLIWTDLIFAFLPSLILGLATAYISGAFARSRTTPNPAAAV